MRIEAAAGFCCPGEARIFAHRRPIERPKLDAEIAVVISNRPDAPGIEVARERGLNAAVLPSKGLDREVYDRQLVDELREKGVELVCLAGYMRILSGHFIARISACAS